MFTTRVLFVGAGEGRRASSVSRVAGVVAFPASCLVVFGSYVMFSTK